MLAMIMATDSVASPMFPSYTWITCGSCPNPPEVYVSGDTITMGIANRSEDDQQPESYHGAATLLSPASQYVITFDYHLYSWDSYISLSEAGAGYWDSFSVSVASQPIWQMAVYDPITKNRIPGLGFIWGGVKWGDSILKHVTGTKTVIVPGNPSGNNYLNVVLDTATEVHTDANYPSWGTITIKSVVTDSDLSAIRQQAAEWAKTVVGGEYLWGGKGWNWNLPKEYVSTEQIVSTGYYYYSASSDPHIIWGKGLDCSGLVYWAYNKAAVSTKYPGYPISQEGAQGQRDSNTTPIGENQLLPGDLLFFSNSATGTNITHVAMYVGGSDSSKNVVEAANSSVGIKYSSKDQLKAYASFRGYGRVTATQSPLLVQTHSPVTIIVTDPDGYEVSSDTFTFTGQEYVRGIPGVLYYSTDENGDDIVYAPVLKNGIYTIQVVPKSDADPSDTFSLEVWGAAKLVDLATDVPITEIPKDGYKITAADNEINPTSYKVYLPIVVNGDVGEVTDLDSLDHGGRDH